MSVCCRCGAAFSCAMVDPDPAAPDQPCWCTALPPALPVPGDGATSCYCPICLRDVIATQRPTA